MPLIERIICKYKIFLCILRSAYCGWSPHPNLLLTSAYLGTLDKSPIEPIDGGDLSISDTIWVISLATTLLTSETNSSAGFL